MGKIEELELRVKNNFAHGAAAGFGVGMTISFVIFLIVYVF